MGVGGFFCLGFVLTLGYVLLVASGSFFLFFATFFSLHDASVSGCVRRRRRGGGRRRGRVLCVKMCMQVVFFVVGLVIESWRICNFVSGLSIVTAGMQLV